MSFIRSLAKTLTATATATAVVIGAALILSGCTFVDDYIFPALTGEPPVEAAQPPSVVEIAPSPSGLAAERAVPPPPRLGQSQFIPSGVTPGAPTGTDVGRHIDGLRKDLELLQVNISAHNGELQQVRAESTESSERYHTLIGQIQARLQVGTTPGDPVLVQQWNDSQTELDKISASIGQMNNLSNRVADANSLASFVLESTRATYGLTGAVDEDRRQLAVLEDEVNRTVVLIDRLLTELNEDVVRQTNYAGRERSNLTVLGLAVKNGELYGGSLANRAFAAAPPLTGRAPGAVGPQVARRPLVVIRFDRPDVEFEVPLYTAVSQALERRPGSAFELVAVSPNQGTPAQVALLANNARRNAERVMRTLNSMGLPTGQMSLSATTSPDASATEVHLYVR